MPQAVRLSGITAIQNTISRNLWPGGLSDEAVEDMANSNLHVMRFLGLNLEDDVPDHSVLSRFRTRLIALAAWDGLLAIINGQIQTHGVMVTQGCHVDVSITHSASLRASRPMRWLTIAKTGTMKPMLQAVTRVVEVTQPSVDTEARWIKKSGKSVFGFISNIP
ncbi:transposase [Nitrosomonas sp.]|uniref:transposase n=1 Tax=Nitrosomonas sp. TaxID=42353 RepID=UPI00374D0DAA